MDDEIFNIFALKQALKKYLLKIDTAENGLIAIEKVEKFKKSENCKFDCTNFKIILMDIEIPLMNGIDTTKKIRNYLNKKDIYIFGCSGYGQNMKDQCFEAGMNDYLVKPVNLNYLIEKITSIKNSFEK